MVSRSCADCSAESSFSHLTERAVTINGMKLPVHDVHDSALRPVSDVRAMAIAVQANLVQLKVSEAKRRGISPEQHEIQVPSPGTVRRFRETLIDHRTLAAYSDQEVHLRLHEVWGQFCLMRWLFSASAPVDSPLPSRERGRGEGSSASDSATLPPDAEMHCAAALEAKHAELHALLWRIRFEQRRRDTIETATADLTATATSDQSRDRKGAVLSPARPTETATPGTSHKRKRVGLSSVPEDRFLTGAAPKKAIQRDELLAAQIPAIVFGKTMDQASDEELLLGACQHAGMLAALRWTLDPRRPWADPGIMDVHDDPFAP